MNSKRYIDLMLKETRQYQLMEFYQDKSDLEGLLVEGRESEWMDIFRYAGENIATHFAAFRTVPPVDYWVDLYNMMKERQQWEAEDRHHE